MLVTQDYSKTKVNLCMFVSTLLSGNFSLQTFIACPQIYGWWTFLYCSFTTLVWKIFDKDIRSGLSGTTFMFTEIPLSVCVCFTIWGIFVTQTMWSYFLTINIPIVFPILREEGGIVEGWFGQWYFSFEEACSQGTGTGSMPHIGLSKLGGDNIVPLII